MNDVYKASTAVLNEYYCYELRKAEYRGFIEKYRSAHNRVYELQLKSIGIEYHVLKHYEDAEDISSLKEAQRKNRETIKNVDVISGYQKDRIIKEVGIEAYEAFKSVIKCLNRIEVELNERPPIKLKPRLGSSIPAEHFLIRSLFLLYCSTTQQSVEHVSISSSDGPKCMAMQFLKSILDLTIETRSGDPVSLDTIARQANKSLEL